MWDTGLQEIFKKEDVNEQISLVEGYLEEKDASRLLIQYLRNNIGIATRLITGIELFPFQEISIKSMIERDFSLLVWSRGLSKSFTCGIFAVLQALFIPNSRIAIVSRSFRQCSSADTYIFTNKGLKLICDSEVGEKTQSIIKPNTILDKWGNPLEDGIKIVTKKGYELKGKIGHGHLVWNSLKCKFEWKNIEDVSTDDFLPVHKGIGLWGDSSVTDVPHEGLDLSCDPKDIAYLLGLYYGDGHFDKVRANLSITSADRETLDFSASILSSICSSSKPREIQKVGSKCKGIVISNVALRNFFKDLGVSFATAREKTIPKGILSLNRNETSAFLNGLFDADGGIYISKRTRGATISLATSSRSMAEQVQLMLLNFGIISDKCYEKARGKITICSVETYGHESWKVRITGYDNLKTFSDYIGFRLSRKRKALLKYLEECSSTRDTNGIPGLSSYLKKKYKHIRTWGIRKNQLFAKKAILKETIQKVLDCHDHKPWLDDEDVKLLDDLLSKNFYYDSIESISPQKMVTYDITVEDEKCYVGNGLISKNSRLIFQKIEEIMAKPGARLLQEALVGQPKHMQDEWVMKFGSSAIGALPLGCLKGDSLVVYKSGIREIASGFPKVERGTWINSSDEVWSDGQFRSSPKKFYNGVAKTKAITTRSGYSLEGTHDHKVKVVDKDGNIVWRQMGDICIGDVCVIDRSEKNANGETSLTDDDGYFFGCMCGDGCWTSKYHLEFINTDESIVSELKKATPELKWKNYKGDYRFYSLSKSGRERFLEKFEVLSAYSHQKEISPAVLRSSSSVLRSCLQGLFDTDGHVSMGKSKGGIVIGYTTTSEKLAKQIQVALLSFGIVSFRKSRDRQVKNTLRVHELLITGVNCKKFYEAVGFRCERKVRTLEEAIRLKKRDWSIGDGIPNLQNVLLQEIKGLRFKKGSGTKKKHGEHFSLRDVKRKKTITQDFLRGIIDKYLCLSPRLSQLEPLCNKNLFFDTVTSTQDGECETFDLSVPENQTYTANGFVSHNSGEKLRGFRFNCLLIDEFLLMPEKIVNEVLLPFLSVNADPIERQKTHDLLQDMVVQGLMTEVESEARMKDMFRDPKLVALSSASYQFEYLYELYQTYIGKIKSGTEDGNALKEDKSNKMKGSYCVLQFGYDVAPSQLYSKVLLEKAKTELSNAQFQREFGAQFSDDSSSYFSIQAMRACTVPEGEAPYFEIIGDPKERYLLSIDPSFSEDESSDFFAMSVYKLLDGKKFMHVHAYAVAGGKLKDHIAYFKYILDSFNIVFITMDNAGGVQFMNSANESKLFKDAKIELDQLSGINFSKVDDYQKELQEARRQYNKEKGKIVYMQVFTSEWIRRANELLQANIDNKRVRFAGDATFVESEMDRMMKADIEIDHLKFNPEETDEGEALTGLNNKQVREVKQLDLIENQQYLIMLTKKQCALIEVKVSEGGHQTFTLPSELKGLKGKRKARRDLYTSLLIGSWGVKVFNDFIDKPSSRTTFEPMFLN